MRIKRLSIENFMLIGEASLHLEGGAYFIEGINEDDATSTSNGAGKSTLCESIVWCLFGETLRKGMRKDDVIGPSGKSTKVELDLEHEGVEYQVIRYRGDSTHGNNVTIWTNGSEISDRGVSGQVDIEQLLGISKSTIYQVAYFSSRKERFVDLTPAALLALVTEIVDLSRYDRISQKLKDFAKKIDQEDLAKCKAQIHSVEIDLATVEGSLTRLEAQLESLPSQRSTMRRTLEARIAELSSKMPTGHPFSVEQYGEYSNYLRVFEEEHSPQLEHMRRERGRLFLALEEADKKIKENKRDRDVAKKDRDRYEEQLVNLQVGQDCRYCGSHIESVSSEIYESIRLQLTKSLATGEQLAVRAKLLRQEIEGYVSEAERLETDLNSYAAQHEVYAEFCRNQIRQYDEVTRQIVSVEDGLKRLRNDLASLDLEDGEHENSIRANIERDKKKHTAKMKALKDLLSEKSRLENLSSILSSVSSLVKDYKERLFNEQILGLKGTINDLFDTLYDGEYNCDVELSKGRLTLLFKNSLKEEYLPASYFSDGEATRINKVVTYALNMLTNVGLVIDDEGVNGMDETGIRSILSFVNDGERFGTYLFVGHQQALKEGFESSRVITVRRNNNICSVEQGD